MSTLLLVVGGFGWWGFFEWLRGLPRYRNVGTQHFCLLGLMGLAVSIGSLIFWVITLL